ncbi:MAG: NADH:flavin oxidoreductase, partial [Clostridia bacterium]|nr:NADH:flavin oxidoreductase [Clostridia bacterium]
SVARLFAMTRRIQQAVPHIPVVGNGYTWLRQFLPYAAAANIRAGSCGMVGLGRGVFAYPDSPRDALNGGMKPEKCCITCSKCTQMMRDHNVTGCPVRDAETYAPLFASGRKEADAQNG